MIVVTREFIEAFVSRSAEQVEVTASFSCIDDGDVFVHDLVPRMRAKNGVLRKGVFCGSLDASASQESDVVIVVAPRQQAQPELCKPALAEHGLKGYVRQGDGTLLEAPVRVVSLESELFSRVHGVLETGKLKNKAVVVIGLGSGGSVISVELAKAGVACFTLIDHDRLEAGNLSRHVCGISDIGRYKTKAIRDTILDRNPKAKITTYENRVDGTFLPTLQRVISGADLVFCCTDNRQSRSLVNFACVAQNRTCIYGGTFRRAYGGQVLRVVPGQTLCYQCFIDTMVTDPEDQEIASQEIADVVGYSDKPVPVEPGLATDIAPIAIMCVKVGILELLKGTATSLESLYADLESPLFQWINRREIDTEYAALPPLDSGTEDLRIMAWYGISCARNAKCPVCGEFYELKPSARDVAKFGAGPSAG